MKSINETFTDEEYQELIKDKKNMTWHDFILSKVYTYSSKGSDAPHLTTPVDHSNVEPLGQLKKEVKEDERNNSV